MRIWTYTHGVSAYQIHYDDDGDDDDDDDDLIEKNNVEKAWQEEVKERLWTNLPKCHSTLWLANFDRFRQHLMNVTQAWDGEKIWVPDRNRTLNPWPPKHRAGALPTELGDTYVRTVCHLTEFKCSCQGLSHLITELNINHLYSLVIWCRWGMRYCGSQKPSNESWGFKPVINNTPKDFP